MVLSSAFVLAHVIVLAHVRVLACVMVLTYVREVPLNFMSSLFANAPPPPLGVYKILNIGISKMQPKIVVMLVLGTPEHLEFSLILQN